MMGTMLFDGQIVAGGVSLHQHKEGTPASMQEHRDHGVFIKLEKVSHSSSVTAPLGERV